jgi:hypothetical protein
VHFKVVEQSSRCNNMGIRALAELGLTSDLIPNPVGHYIGWHDGGENGAKRCVILKRYMEVRRKLVTANTP